MNNRYVIIVMLIVVFIAMLHGGSQDSIAQGELTPEVTEPVTPATDTPTPTATPDPITVTNSEPTVMTSGSEVNLTIFGTNFTDDTTVRLIGYGIIPTVRLNSGVLQATTPRNLNPNTYTIEVSDPVRGTVISPNTLRIDSPPQPTGIPTNTPLPPTLIPGAPQLVVRNYRLSPQPARPGNEALLTVTLFNQGVRTAEGVSAEIQAGGAFVPSSNQSTVVIANIVPGQQTQFTIPVRVASDAPTGTNGIGLTVNYRDFQGSSYSTQASLTGEVESVVEVSELTITRYDVNPNPLQPGQPVNLTVVVTNTGSSTAQQAVLRVPVGAGVLLAGIQGNNFPLGDFPPGFDFTITLPLFVQGDAAPGIQSQPIQFEYFADGTPQSSEVNLTFTIDTPLSSSILLDSYDIGTEQVQPGERFTLDAVLKNVGGLPVQEAFVSFTLAPTSNGTSNNATTTSTFAPVGSGGTQFLGAIPADDNGIRFEQDFIVNGDVDSGVYNLPIVVRYRNQDGTTDELVLNASILVVVPPRLRVIERTPIIESVRLNRPIDLSLSLLNLGSQEVSLITASIIGENAEVIGQDEILLQALRPNDEQVIDANLTATGVGIATIRIEILYLNSLNQEEIFVQEYQVEVLPPPPTQPPATPEPFVEPPLELRTPMPDPELTMPDDFWGRLLLGLLGLGR